MEELRWDLTELYPGPESPEVESDLRRVAELAEEFGREYRGKINTPDLTADLLARALTALEEILKVRWKLYAYSYLLCSLNTQDQVASALEGRIQETDAASAKHWLFFELEWKAFPKEQAEALINNPELARWKHYLQSMRRYIPHTLTEPEEIILRELSPAIDAWEKHFEKITGRIRVGGKPLAAALSECNGNPDREIRRRTYNAITRALKQAAPYIVDVLNASFLADRIICRLKHFEEPMAIRNLENELSATAVEALLTTCDEATDIVARYYRLKRRLLGVPQLSVYDRYAPLPLDAGTSTLEEARQVIIGAYTAFSPEMGELATRFFDESWIDTPVVRDKRGGAYAYPIPFLHPFILINWTGKRKDVLTLAHELGHGIHQILYSPLSVLQSDPPTVIAETASIFGEMLVFERLKMQAEKPEERLSLLCHALEDAFATSFRQAAITRFEQRIHEARTEGELPIEMFNTLWLETQRAVFAGSVTIPDSYGWWWAYIHHLLHPFYCYSYTFGQLLVLALYAQYREDGVAFVPGYLNLLRAGGSDSPANLLKEHIGIDVEDPTFWRKGIGILREMAGEAEELASQLRY